MDVQVRILWRLQREPPQPLYWCNLSCIRRVLAATGTVTLGCLSWRPGGGPRYQVPLQAHSNSGLTSAPRLPRALHLNRARGRKGGHRHPKDRHPRPQQPARAVMGPHLTEGDFVRASRPKIRLPDPRPRGTPVKLTLLDNLQGRREPIVSAFFHAGLSRLGHGFLVARCDLPHLCRHRPALQCAEAQGAGQWTSNQNAFQRGSRSTSRSSQLRRSSSSSGRGLVFKDHHRFISCRYSHGDRSRALATAFAFSSAVSRSNVSGLSRRAGMSSQ